MIFKNNHYFHQNADLYKEQFRNDFNPFEIILHGYTFDKGPYHYNWVGYFWSQKSGRSRSFTMGCGVQHSKKGFSYITLVCKIYCVCFRSVTQAALRILRTQPKVNREEAKDRSKANQRPTKGQPNASHLVPQKLKGPPSPQKPSKPGIGSDRSSKVTL